MNNDALSRLDTALRLLADVTQELHALRALVADQEPECPQEPGTTPVKLSSNDQMLVNMWDSMEALGCAVTITDLLNVAWSYYPCGDARRDLRKVNAHRDIKRLIAKGIFVERFGGELTLSSSKYLKEKADT